MTGRRLTVAAVVVALVQIGFLSWTIHSRAALLRNGQDVLLRTQPVNPRDLLRGDYVALRYDISRLPVTLVQTERARDSEVVGTVYVRLRKGEGDAPASAVAVGLGAPVAVPLRAGEVDIRGESLSRWQTGVDTISVVYGLERFYLPEGEGRAVERAVRERSFTMLVAVGETGRAQIKSLFDNGQPIYQEPLY